MANKWIKLHWMRPKTAHYPNMWRTFVGRDLDSDKLTEYRIQDLTESSYDEAIKHMEAFYLRDEPVSQVLGQTFALKNETRKVNDNNETPEYRLCSNSTFSTLCKSPKTRKMYDVDSVLTKQFNVFDSYGVSEYLYLHNMAVDKRFRGLNIGLQFLEAGKHFCRHSNIKIMHGVFTSDYSSRLAETFGFNENLGISFDELCKLRPELGIQGIGSKQMTLRSYRV